ncbi:DUF5693 family protein [Natranaerofaba carboxydovora]|uniref:DUF5693 family protein n=1 Tax=Natranaerofaba carboxydovora TaxID=2742683 RepID=UPI001F138C34|nr:DUF5693 family protein [Natranaerofaba carboxydovora]UMZ75087.1 hypothetical protein ACONDI_02699 [Natranaerofaba carboxydovora]
MKTGFKILIFLGLIIALYLGFTKHSIESQNKAVDLVMDYDSLKSEEQIDKLPSLKDSGLTSVALDMSSLSDLESDGEIISIQGDELTFYKEVAGAGFENVDFPINRDNVYLLIENEGLRTQIYNVISEDPEFNDEVEFYDNVIMISEEGEELIDEPILYSKEAIDNIQESGLGFVPRIPDDSSLDKFNRLKSELPEFDTIIFSGEEIVGYPDEIEALASFLMENQIKFGYIEPFVATQDGSDMLAQNMNYNNMVRVHSTRDATLDSLEIDGALRQFTRAVEERNVRVLYLKPFEEGEETLHFLNDLTANLQDSGYYLGSSSPFEFIGGMTLLRYLIMVSLTAYISFYSGNFNKKLPIPLFVAGMLLLLTTYTLKINLIYALAAFAIAVLTPVWLLNYIYNSNSRDQSYKNTLLLFGFSMLIALLGGVTLQGVLLDSSYLLQVNMFRGVRLALILPFVIGFIYLFYLQYKNIDKLMKSFYKLFNSPILLKHIILGLLVISVVGVFLTRAGNDPLIAVSDFEIEVRNYLESIFQIRPRFKSFLFGYPLLFIGIYLTLKDKKYIWLVLIGLMGPINTINSFAHVHTPIMVSFAREIFGAALGLILGTGLVYAYRRWMEYDYKSRLFRLLRLG